MTPVYQLQAAPLRRWNYIIVTLIILDLLDCHEMAVKNLPRLSLQDILHRANILYTPLYL